MPTFIDESGDTGWSDAPRQRSAAFYRMAAVWLPSRAEATACRAAIRDLWRSIPLPAAVAEFHYTDSGQHPEWREAFFRAALGHGFRFAVASFDKRRVWRHRPDRRELFRECAVALAMTLRPCYAAAERRLPADPKGRPPRLAEELVADDNMDPVLMDELREAFLPLGTFGCGTRQPARFLGPKPWFADSRAEELIQLADMVCGAVGDHLAGKTGGSA